jgi:uncharacterized protein YdaU (DUF1376 family)
MNFYKHHLGDYDGHTSHLSWDEDMAYTRLLRAYYRREKGIPDAEKYRLARAASKAHKAAVDSVLAEFFTRDGDDWKQKRADEEIEAYQAQAETNRRIARERTVQRTVNDSSTKGIPNHKPEPEPESTPRKRGSPKTQLPKDFGISDRVRAWGAARGYHNLEAHFESFISKVKAKGYTYVDWDEGFMGAIRDDWAKIGKGSDNRPRLAQ